MLKDFVSNVYVLALKILYRLQRLKTQCRRVLFRRSTTYFLVSFLSACLQIIFRSALYVTDNNGFHRQGAEIFPSSLLGPAENFLYRVLNDGSLQSCKDVPGACFTLALEDMRFLSNKSDPVFDSQLCPMIASYASNG